MGRVENMEFLAEAFGCQVGSLPPYLGLLLGAPFKFVTVWDNVRERL